MDDFDDAIFFHFLCLEICNFRFLSSRSNLPSISILDFLKMRFFFFLFLVEKRNFGIFYAHSYVEYNHLSYKTENRSPYNPYTLNDTPYNRPSHKEDTSSHQRFSWHVECYSTMRCVRADSKHTHHFLSKHSILIPSSL